MTETKSIAHSVNEALEQLKGRMLPGHGKIEGGRGYTSMSEIREHVLGLVRTPVKPTSLKKLEALGLDPTNFQQPEALSLEKKLELAEAWIEKLTNAAKKRGRLMTETQLADWRIGRKWAAGDRARYIGPSRNETTLSGIIVPRPHGQLGVITRVDKRDGTLVFHPLEAVAPLDAPSHEPQFVDLLVKEHTPGWLLLERVPQ